MKKAKKEQYITATISIVLGVIMLIVTLTTGIGSAGGMVTALLTLLFGGIGITSFFSPSVAEVFFHWIKNVVENQRQTETNQKQNNPVKSPQTGIIQGDQYIHYTEEKKEESVKKNGYNKEKIEKRLLEIKSRLGDLKSMNHKEGKSTFSPLKIEVKGIIHKVYSDHAERAEKRLIHPVFFFITDSTTEQDYQDWYEEDVENLISTIDIIIREMELE